MALARKCDICGKYYENYNIANSGPEARKIHNGMAFVSIDNSDKYFTDRPMDCCPGCLDSIKRHIDSLKGETYGEKE